MLTDFNLRAPIPGVHAGLCLGPQSLGYMLLRLGPQSLGYMHSNRYNSSHPFNQKTGCDNRKWSQPRIMICYKCYMQQTAYPASLCLDVVLYVLHHDHSMIDLFTILCKTWNLIQQDDMFFCFVWNVTVTVTYDSLISSSLQWSTSLYCTVLYCTYCTVLYLLYCTVLYLLYCIVLHFTALYCTVLYCTVLYCIVLYCT